MARSITKTSNHEHALSYVAVALAKAGEHDHAEAIGRSITDPYGQLWTVLGIVRELLATGDTNRAEAGTGGPGDRAAILGRSRRLLALALAQAQATDYTALLSLVAQVDPAAVIEAATNIPHV